MFSKIRISMSIVGGIAALALGVAGTAAATTNSTHLHTLTSVSAVASPSSSTLQLNGFVPAQRVAGHAASTRITMPKAPLASTHLTTGIAPAASSRSARTAGCISYGVDWSGGWRNWHAWIIVPAPCFTIPAANWACIEALSMAGEPELDWLCYPAAVALSHIIAGHHGVWAAFYFLPPHFTGGYY